MSSLARILSKLQLQNSANSLSADIQKQLQHTTSLFLKQVQEETDFYQIQIVVEDIVIHCLQNN